MKPYTVRTCSKCKYELGEEDDNCPRCRCVEIEDIWHEPTELGKGESE